MKIQDQNEEIRGLDNEITKSQFSPKESLRMYTSLPHEQKRTDLFHSFE